MNIYIQYIFIAVTIAMAIWYIVRLVKSTFSSKKNCGDNCKCGKN